MKKMLKGVFSLVLSVVIVSMSCMFSFAAEGQPPVEIKAKAAVLMDASTGRVLMKYNENEKLYPASVTKIMPLLLVMEAIDGGRITLNDVVTVSGTAAAKGGSQIWLKEGEQMTVDELLKATAVYSANDACTALGEYIAGSDDAFVKMLNDRAKELGMTNTHFENCTGLDDTTENHLTTAMDVATMSMELLKHELIVNYTTIWMDSLRDGQTELVNTNKLVRFYEGTTGLKTGTTSKAGCCVSASAMRDGTHLIAVVMGSENSSDRFETAKAMLNWGFANYSTVTPVIDNELIPDVGVINGIEEKISPEIPLVEPVLIEKGREGEITRTIDLAVDVAAPVEKGQVLGTVTFSLGDEELGKYNLTAPDSVNKLTFLIVFARVLKAVAQ
ncbi:MAG: D-alanyl-D-alanine carboxypeptidase [Clostridia bacterium]|nr:D-alanyl-D-alanine carboxypeptidase [Clostridia bacterium]